MRAVFGILLFWIIVISTKQFLENKCKIDRNYSLVLTFTGIGIYEFLLGILNLMQLGTILYIMASLIYFAYCLIKKKIHFPKKETLKDPAILGMSVLFIYVTIIGFQMHLTHYDNFSHWGLIVKTMFTYNRFPNFENTYIYFKGYQPGSACFLYFLGFLCGKTEGSMIIGQNYLILAYLSTFISVMGKEKRGLKSLFLLAFYIMVMITSEIAFHNLLVDSLLAFMFLSAYLIWKKEEKNPKKAISLMLPIMIYLFLVKNAGVLLDGILCLIILYRYWKDKKIKEGFKQVCIIGGILVLLLLIWQGHVSMVYGHWALNTKHSLSPQNLYSSFKELGMANMMTFIKMYIRHFFQLKENTPTIFMIIINFVLLIGSLLSDNKKKILQTIGWLDLLYIGYYCILGLMYIFSMPWEEAKVFAGYTRYMMTIVSVIIGISMKMIWDQKLKKKDSLYKILCTIVLLVPIYYYQGPFQSLLGKDDYKGSIIEKVDQILPNIPKEEKYYIYSPGNENDNGYLIWLMTYKLETREIYPATNLQEIPSSSIVIVLDPIELEDSSIIKLQTGLYRKA